MSLINTEIKPFTRHRLPQRRVRRRQRRRPEGQVVGRLLLPGRLHLRLPDRARRPRRQLRRRSRSSASRSTRVSTDTHFTHKAWHDTSDTIGKIEYPMHRRPDRHDQPQLRRACIEADGLADRGTFVVDPDGMIQLVEINAERHRPQRRRAAPQGQGRPVRRRPPERGLPGQVGRGRRHPRPVARPRRQDLTRRRGRRSAACARHRPAPHGRPPPSLHHRTPEARHARRRPHRPAEDPPREDHRARSSSSPSLDDGPKSAELRRAARRDRRAVRPHHRRAPRRRRAPPVVRHRPGRHRRRACASPASRSATSSPRSCSPCSRSAATRRPRRAEVDRADRRTSRASYHFETYFSLVVPELPRRGAGAQPDERAQPATSPTSPSTARCSRTRSTPARCMAVPTVFLNGELFDQGRMSLEQIVGQARHRRRRARRPSASTTRTRSTCSSSAAARPAPRRRSTPPARASAPASPPSASAARCSTRWPSRTSSRCPTPRARSSPPRSSSTSRSTTSTS